MKKKLILVFILLCGLFSVKSVHAEALPCTWLGTDFSSKTGITVKEFYQSSMISDVRIGDKVYIALYVDGKLDKNVDYRVYFRSTTDSSDLISVPLKGVATAPGSNGAGIYSAYYNVPETAKIGSEYKYLSFGVLVNDLDSKQTYTTPSGTEVTTYDLFCGRFVFDEAELEWHKSWNPTLLTYGSGPKTIRITGGKKEQVPANNVLKSITIDRNEVFAEGTMNFTVSVTEPVSNVDLGFMSPNGNILSVVLLGSYGNSTTFTARGNAPSARALSYYPLGNYELHQVTLYDQNGNMISYSKGYTEASSNLEYNAYYFPLSLSLNFNLKKSDYVVGNEGNVSIYKLKFGKDTGIIGSTVPLTFDCGVANKMTLKSVHINFYDEDTKAMFSSYLKSLDSDSYFSIPSIAKEGTYKIDSIVFTVDIDQKGLDTIVIKDTIENEKYKDIFAQKLVVTKNNNQNVLYFATEDLNETAYETIKNSQENSIVIVDADYQTIIPAKLFDVIKETSRQLIINYQDNEWIMNGVDIVNNKNIDIAMKFYSLEESNVSSNLQTALDDKTLVLEFPENGELPGTTLIRIKDTEVFEKLQSDKYYIYYVDEDNNTLNKVALELQKSYDGYIEFYITHNSKYVISSKEVTDTTVLGEDEDVLADNTSLKEETNQLDSNKVLLYTVIGVSAFIIIVLVIIIISMKKNGSAKKEVKEETESTKIE